MDLTPDLPSQRVVDNGLHAIRNVGPRYGGYAPRPLKSSNGFPDPDALDRLQRAVTHTNARAYRYTVAVALVGVGVAVGFQVSEAQAAAVRAREVAVAIFPNEAQAGEQRLPALDHFEKLRALPAKDDADSVGAVHILVADPVAEDGVGFAAAPGAAVADVVSWARDEVALLGLGFPDDF